MEQSVPSIQANEIYIYQTMVMYCYPNPVATKFLFCKIGLSKYISTLCTVIVVLLGCLQGLLVSAKNE